MGVSGNDMATLEGNPRGHACTALRHHQPLDAQMSSPPRLQPERAKTATCPRLN
jgi:hypothetical protein